MAVTPKMHLTGASSNSANELGVDFLTPLTYETAPGRLLTSNKMKISSFIRHVRSRWKGFGRRMQSPSVASNGTKVGEDETEVLAGSLETPFNESGWRGPSDGSRSLGRVVGLPNKCFWQRFHLSDWRVCQAAAIYEPLLR